MKLCYQVSTPDVEIAPSVTAYQGKLEESFSVLSRLGYDGIEFMTINPKELNWNEIKQLTETYSLPVVLICTGEIYGQLCLSLTDPNEKIREEAISKIKEIIDFASFFDANINIGRIRGEYSEKIPSETTYRWALEAFREISKYAEPKNVKIALETVTAIQTNFINTMREAAEMVDDVGCDNFNMMLDVFHLNIEEKDMLACITGYKDYYFHVHLSDNNRRYPGNCGMDFEKIINTFYKAGYNGVFCTEIFQIPDQNTAAKESIEHLAPIFNKIYGRKFK